MKTWLKMQYFNKDPELRTGVNERLKSQAAKFNDNGIIKLVQHYDKCLNFNRDYVEK